MTYEEALLHKKESEAKADKSVTKMFHIAIVPSNTEESNRYIEDFLKNPETFTDETCQKYSSDGDYEVVSFGKEES